MPLLSTADRQRVVAQWMRDNVEATGFTKAQLQAALDATDQWVEDNTASFNSALPAAFRTSATLAQKTMLLGYVLWKRIGRLDTGG